VFLPDPGTRDQSIDKEKGMPSEIKAPTYDELMWPVLVAMKALGGSATHDELLEKVIELGRIPEAVQNVMHTERQTKISYNLAWAKTYSDNLAPSKIRLMGSGQLLKRGRGSVRTRLSRFPQRFES
jgi:restriction system protein